jgi:hypothetical protein
VTAELHSAFCILNYSNASVGKHHHWRCGGPSSAVMMRPVNARTPSVVK